MCDPTNATINNLIDLTIEPASPKLMSMTTALPPMDAMIVAHSGRPSMDHNNPFDRLEKIANQFDDPFEIVHTQSGRDWATCYNSARHVNTESLIFIENSPQKCPEPNASSIGDTFSSCHTTDTSSTMNKAFLTESSINCGSDVSGDRNNAFRDSGPIGPRPHRIHSDPNAMRIQKTNELMTIAKGRSSSVDHPQPKRNPLLRLSLVNSSFGSPMQRPFAKMDNCELGNLSIFGDDDYDDLMATSMHWIDSDGDVDAEVESKAGVDDPVVVVPTQNSLSPEKNQAVQPIDRKALIETFEKHKRKMNDAKVQLEKSITPPAQTELCPADGQWSDLLERVQQVIGQSQCTETKAEATVLLDSLNVVLGQKRKMPVPSRIVRQATFNMEEVDESHRQPSSSPERVVSPDAGVSNIVQQLEQLLGAHNVNVLDSSNVMPTRRQDGTQAATYIVVMNTPNTIKYEEESPTNHSVSNYLKTRNRRSASLSLPHKPSDVSRAIQVKADQRQLTNANHTPMRSSGRRSSFSHTNATEPSTQSARRSIYAMASPSSKSTTSGFRNSPPPPPPRKPVQPKPATTVPSQTLHPPSFALPSCKPNAARTTKLKLRMPERLKPSHGNGPMRATIPIKKIAPHLQSTSPSSLASPTETSDASCSLLSTMTTSTPRIGHSIAIPPSACSTPMYRKSVASTIPPPPVTPIRRRASQIGTQPDVQNRVRYTHFSHTPNPKSGTSISTIGRRRSLSEVKPVPKASIVRSAATGEPLKINVSKKTVSFLQQPRLFGAVTTPNKENKMPNGN